MDGQGVMRPQYSVADRCSYTAGFDMHVNLAAVHFGIGLALRGRSLASSLYRAFRLCLGYHCTVVLPLINLQWDAERFVDTALEDNESKNNCNASMRGLQNMLGLLEKLYSDQCDHLSNWAVGVCDLCNVKITSVVPNKTFSGTRITWRTGRWESYCKKEQKTFYALLKAHE